MGEESRIKEIKTPLAPFQLLSKIFRRLERNVKHIRHQNNIYNGIKAK